MYLIKSISKNHEFHNIIDYNIDNQPNLIEKIQYVNGTRKKIITDYEDVSITFKFGINDIEQWKKEITKLIDNDTFEFKNNEGIYERAKFIFTIPPITYKNCNYVDEIEILMEKSANV